ncbi:MAG: 8-amino-7-oxononanoate synthase [Deltaproteobacteria bacterium]|nr:8-amino-7-oxononanoate synthase [Deltaproteobacteria bacterium]
MEWIEEYLDSRGKDHLLRTLTPVHPAGPGRVRIGDSEYVNFSSNDYLGLAGHPRLLEEGIKAAEEYGTSSSASRLMSGDLLIHHQLEALMADFVGKEKALLFGSGYLANIGIVPALCDKKDVIFSDRLNHASIVDGILLSGARFFRFRHNDLNHLEDLLKKERKRFNKALIIAESVFSMDGDRAPLKEMVELKERYDALFMLDEAHAVGVFGKRGAGVAEEDGLVNEVDIFVGTFGKALGSYGAYVAGDGRLIDYCINKARSFIYSTALPPAVIGASIGGIRMLTEEPLRRKVLLEKAAYFRGVLKEKGFNVKGTSQIVPVIVGENDLTLKISDLLRSRYIFALAVRPPTVPAGESRIRFSVTYNHSEEDLQRAADILKDGF